jgi:hypothetical protein
MLFRGVVKRKKWLWLFGGAGGFLFCGCTGGVLMDADQVELDFEEDVKNGSTEDEAAGLIAEFGSVDRRHRKKLSKRLYEACAVGDLSQAIALIAAGTHVMDLYSGRARVNKQIRAFYLLVVLFYYHLFAIVIFGHRS